MTTPPPQSRRVLLHTLAMGIWLGCLGGACTFRGEVPEGTLFSCTQDSECPPDFACQRNQQTCVRKELLDLTPPAIVDGGVTLLIRGPSNVLTNPDAVTFGSTAEIRFAVNEPLAAATLAPPGCSAACAGPTPSGTGYLLSCTVQEGPMPVDGTCALTVTLEDRAGNRAPQALPEFRIDVTPPSPPDSVTPGRIIYRREPWGVDGGPASDSVIASPGAATGAVRVLIRSGSIDRGIATVSPAGEFRDKFLSIPTAELEVASVDSAGNVSAYVRVLDGEWVATLGGKRVGESVPNPHRLDGYSVASDTLIRSDGVEYGAPHGLGAVDAVGPKIRGGLTWRRGDFTAGEYFAGSQSVFDPARGKVINVGGAEISSGGGFGGVPDGVNVHETIGQWTGHGWETITPADPEGDGQASALQGHSLVYDPIRRQVILHGGTQNTIASTQTWAWNGASWRRLPDGPALREAVAFWSTRISKMVVAGGRSTPAGPPLSETWTFDGLFWEQLDAGFPPRARVPSVYSPTEGVGWMFGGGQDLWRFDGARWEHVDAGPGPVIGPASAFIWNADRRAAWLMGAPEVWEWDSQRWSLVTDGGPSGVAYEYDARRSEVVTIDARVVSPRTGSMTVMNDAGVVTLAPAAVLAESQPAVACSIRLGGCVRVSDGGLYDLKRAGWVFRSSAPAIPASTAVALEADPTTGNALAVVDLSDGGRRAHLIAPSGTFTQVADPPPFSPPPLPFGYPPPFTVGLTPWNGGLLATSNQGDNSWWTGSAWVPLSRLPIDGTFLASTTVGAIADGGVCVSHHPAPLSPLAVGAKNYFSSLDSGFATAPPLNAAAGAMLFDSERQVTYHFGGRANWVPAKTLLWQAPLGTWRPVSVPDTDAPGPRYYGTMRFDPVNRRGILTGGTTAFLGPHLSDTWFLEAANERPSAVFRVVASALGINDRVQFSGIRVAAVAGASSEATDGGQAHGVRAALWAEGRFKVSGAENAASDQQPTPVILEVTDPADLRLLLMGQPELLVGITPRGTNGRGTAELSVDYVELTVRYRLQ